MKEKNMSSTFTHAEESTILAWVANAIRHGLDIKRERKKKLLRFIAHDADLKNLELSGLSDGKLLCALVLAINPTLVKKPCAAALGCIAEFQKAAPTLRTEDFELLLSPHLCRAADESCSSGVDKRNDGARVAKSRLSPKSKEIRGILDYSDPISFSERVRGFNVPGSPAIFPEADPELALKKPLIGKHTAAFNPQYSKVTPHQTTSVRNSRQDAQSCASNLSPICGDDASSSDESSLESSSKERGSSAFQETKSVHKDELDSKSASFGRHGTTGSDDFKVPKHQLIDSESDDESEHDAVLSRPDEVRVSERKRTPCSAGKENMLTFGQDGEVCDEDGVCTFGFDHRGFRSSMITRIEKEVSIMSGSELPSLRGYMYKKSPSKRQLYRYQRRYCVLKNLHLAWWGSERDMLKKQEAKGSVSFVFHECVVVLDKDDATKFALAPREGRWENPSSFTGGGKRVIAFDCSERGERSRDAWLEILSLHILAACKVRQQVGNLAHLSSPTHVQFDTMT